MYRPASALILAAVFAAPAGAQPRQLPLSPGVYPGSAIGPGTQFLPLPTPSLVAGVRGAGRPFAPANGLVPGYFPYPAYGFGTGFNNFGTGFGGFNGFGGFGGFGVPFFGPGYGYGFGSGFEYNQVGPIVVGAAPAAASPAPPERAVVLANEFPATLTVQFPAPAEVWLNGTAVAGEAAEERVLTSPVLRPGDRHTFDVKARWTLGGKTYEAARTVALGSGDRSRLLVVSGNEVK